MRTFTAALVFLLAGCTGRITEPSAKSKPVGGAPAPMPAAPQSCTASDPGRVLQHRLNRREYDNVVRDLFGLTSHPGASLPDENVATYFDDDASLLGMTPDELEQLFDAADAAATDAIAHQRSTVMVCDPTVGAACARTLISHWGRLAFRRTLTDAQVSQIYQAVFVPASTGGTFDEGVHDTLVYLLTSPRFLYPLELHSSPDDPTVIEPLDGPALATRLSLFLWSSTPDAVLLDLAEQTGPDGHSLLQSDEVLAAQIARMLADPRATVLADDFATQWLGLSELDVVAKSPTLFPGFDAVRADMKTETQLFLRDLFTTDQPMQQLLTAPYSYLNQNLATFYGLPGVTGTGFSKVSLDPSLGRAGFLTQGSFLSINAEIGRTSIVKRGAYVLERILCAPAGAPPPGVGALPPATNGPETLRQMMEAHATNPACSGCHSRMDPIGFGLEKLDAVGRPRTLDNGLVIDDSGTLPDGRTFVGAVQLTALLGPDPGVQRCVTGNLAQYALHRSTTPADACAIQNVALGGTQPKTTHQLLEGLMMSDLFRKHRGEEAP